MFWTTFTWRRTNFCPAKNFDQTLCSQGTVQYFCSIPTEFWTAGCLNFCTVKVVPCERGLAFCKIILNFPTIFLWRTAVLWRTSHVKRIIYYITWKETIRELKQRHFTRHTPTGGETFFLLIWLVDATKFVSCGTLLPENLDKASAQKCIFHIRLMTSFKSICA